MDAHRSAFLSSFASLYNSKADSDFQVRAFGKVFHVHKLILRQQNGYFGSLLNGTKYMEAEAGHVDLTDVGFEPDVVEACLKHLYGIPYQIPGFGSYAPTETRDPFFHAKVYSAADYFGLDGVKALACELFRGCVKCNTAPDLEYMLRRPETPNDGEIPSRIQDTLAGLIFDAAAYVYTTTPEEDRGLRDLVVENAVRHYEVLVVNNEDARRVLDETPQLAVDLLLNAHNHFSRSLGIDSVWICEECGVKFSAHGVCNEFRAVAGEMICPSCGNQTARCVQRLDGGIISGEEDSRFAAFEHLLGEGGI